MPVRGDFFSASDLGTDASAANTALSSDAETSDSDGVDQSDDGLGSEDEGGEYDAAAVEHGADHDDVIKNPLGRGRKHRENDQNDDLDDHSDGGEAVEDEREEEGDVGYGKDGLSWEAVMAQVIGAVRFQLLIILTV